jgi:hypothetical protein
LFTGGSGSAGPPGSAHRLLKKGFETEAWGGWKWA